MVGTAALAIWLICFTDGHCIHELRLVLHALTTCLCHLYLAALAVRFSIPHFAKAAWHTVLTGISFCATVLLVCFLLIDLLSTNGVLDDKCTDKVLSYIIRISKFAFTELQKIPSYTLEGVCVLFDSAPHLQAAALSLCAAASHCFQGALYLLLSTLRSLQLLLLSLTGEKDRWQRERKRVTEERKKLSVQVEEYLSVYCQDPVTSLWPKKNEKKREKTSKNTSE